MELHEDAVAHLRSTYDLLGKVANVWGYKQRIFELRKG